MPRPILTASLLAAAAMLAALAATPPGLAAARIVIVNVNDPGEGFNDPTPAVPVGGNTGTTIGEQRLIAFEYAAGIWGSHLDSKVTISIQAGFFPLFCSGGSAVLGAAGPNNALSDFPGAEFPQTFYPIALANKLALTDLIPGPPGTDADDIGAIFSTSPDNPSCLGPVGWYYGLDDQHGSNLDLVTVLLHELGHGLGFVSFVDESTGENPDPRQPDVSDIYSRNILDTTTNLHWNEMTTAQRQASALNVRRLAWGGHTVTADVPTTLSLGTPDLRILSPQAIAGVYDVGSAAFGPRLTQPGISGSVVAALDPSDGAGPSTTDACSPLTNAADVQGRIALVDRGTCGFPVKVRNAQAAGALGVIVADTAPGRPPSALGGSDPTIVIPSVRISRADGTTIKSQLAAGVTATLGVDPTQFSGADAGGRALVFAADPVQPGSTISHWDPIAFPNQLMEPVLNSDLTHAVEGVDLTLPLFRDIGWYPDEDLDGAPDASDACPHSDLGPEVIIDGCDTDVPNSAVGAGCTISDRLSRCAASARNHGAFVSCAAALTGQLRRDGTIDNRQKSAIQRCAAHASVP